MTTTAYRNWFLCHAVCFLHQFIHTCPQVCFKDAFFSLLPRMRYGLFYNTPLVSYPSCIWVCVFVCVAPNQMSFTYVHMYLLWRNCNVTYFQCCLTPYICFYLTFCDRFSFSIYWPFLPTCTLISALVINMQFRSNIYVMYSKAQQVLMLFKW